MIGKRKKKNNTYSDRKLITKIDPRSPATEQYKTIRSNIQFAAIDRDIHSIMVTSSNPGEGKSTTVANLAVVFAQQGKKVLLVDTDLRKPVIHSIFNMNNNIGLTNVLTKRKSLADAVKPTHQANLFILPSGPIPPNPAELLSSSAMKKMYELALGKYDLVIFDTPPLLAVTDAQIVSDFCDGTILVVSSEKTKVEEVDKGLELLKRANANMLGVVLNNKKVTNKNHYYYYYGTNQ